MINYQKPISVYISGPLNLGPIGRHFISFYLSLFEDKNIHIVTPYSINEMKVFGLPIRKINKYKKYDFFVYTGVLNAGKYDYQEYKYNNSCATIKICYPVFDGTVPPLDWVVLINKYFDICLSPSDYVAMNLRRYGVTRPCFGLHCAVLNKKIIDISPRKDQSIFRFGFIGAGEQRKNPIKVVQAFIDAFDLNDNVELYIHCSYSFEKNYFNKLKKLIKNCSISPKIFYSEGEVDNDEIVKIYSNIDCYVYPQKAGGYFTTIVEALSAGLPIIISDICIHQELIDTSNLSRKDGVFIISSKKAESLYHQSLDNRHLGVQYDCEVNSIAKEMINVKLNKVSIFNSECINKRKKIGYMFSHKKLCKKYISIFNPKKIVISNNSLSQESMLQLNSIALVEKYKIIFGDEVKCTVGDKVQEVQYKLYDELNFRLIEAYACKEQNKYINNKVSITESLYMRRIFFSMLRNESSRISIFLSTVYSCLIRFLRCRF